MTGATYGPAIRLRHARMPNHSTVLMSRGGHTWNSEIENISATGVCVRRPNGWDFAPGVDFVLDMLIGDALTINVEATLVRLTRSHLGFAYARIPEDKEAPLWNLLGGYADRLEVFDTQIQES
jgi:hypothetical protein